jgi:hypothetical protein
MSCNGDKFMKLDELAYAHHDVPYIGSTPTPSIHLRQPSSLGIVGNCRCSRRFQKMDRKEIKFIEKIQSIYIAASIDTSQTPDSCKRILI